MTQPRKDFSLFQRKSKNKISADSKTENAPVKTLAELRSVLAAGDLQQARLILREHRKFLLEKSARSSQSYYSLGGVEEVTTALHDAVVDGRIGVVKMFLEEGLEVDERVKHEGLMLGYVSLIELAAHCGQLEIVQFLAEKGARMSVTESCNWRNRDTTNHHYTHCIAILLAVQASHADVADYLLAYAVSQNKLTDKHKLLEGKDLFLSEAAAAGSRHMVEALLEHGASISGALAYAFYCYNGKLICSNFKDAKLNEEYLRIVETLLDYASGVDFETKAYDGHDLRQNNLPFLTPIELMSWRPVGAGGYFANEGHLPILNFIGVTVDGQPVRQRFINDFGRNFCWPLRETNSQNFQLIKDPERKELLIAKTAPFAAEKLAIRM